jgi:hypothetical protein
MPATKKKVASIAFAGAAAAAAVGAAINPALAVDGTWYVRAAGALFHGAVTGQNKGVMKIVDTTHKVTLTCKYLRGSGSVQHSKITGTPAHLGTIKKVSTHSCSFLGNTFKAHLTKPASIFGSTYKDGITKGKVKGLHAEWSGVNVPGCRLSASGSLSGSYHNATHELVTDVAAKPTMKVTHATVACPVAEPGDKVYVQGQFPVTTPKSLKVSEP